MRRYEELKDAIDNMYAAGYAVLCNCSGRHGGVHSGGCPCEETEQNVLLFQRLVSLRNDMLKTIKSDGKR